jgi:hypothetical protein
VDVTKIIKKNHTLAKSAIPNWAKKKLARMKKCNQKAAQVVKCVAVETPSRADAFSVAPYAEFKLQS